MKEKKNIPKNIIIHTNPDTDATISQAIVDILNIMLNPI
jgi:hypothetical protein